MSEQNVQLALGGGCFWCTEGVFASLRGVISYEQGWASAAPPNHSDSEAVLVTFDPKVIALEDVIAVHLLTHASQSNHSQRSKYRSAVYCNEPALCERVSAVITKLSAEQTTPYITQAFMLEGWRANEQKYQDYFYSNPERPFCQTHIVPKLKQIMAKYGQLTNTQLSATLRS